MPSTRKPLRSQFIMAAGAALALVVTTPTLSAQADPVYPSAGQVNEAKAAAGNKAVQVAAVEAQMMASNARLAQVRTTAEAASEKYNLARILFKERTDAAKAAGKRAAAAQKTADLASDKLGQFAATVYMQGGNLGQLEAFLSSKGPQEVLDRASGIALITDIRNGIMQDADASSVVAGVLRRQAALALAQQLAAQQAAETARAAAQVQVTMATAETARIHTQQSAMVAQLATLRNTSVALETQRQDGLKARSEARAAAAAQAASQARANAAANAATASASAARRRAAAAEAERLRKIAQNQPVTPAPAPAPAPAPPPAYNPPAPSRGGVAGVLAFARAQVGKPYQWGGSGPNTWDCSGLTQAAWATAGVSLAHYTGYQYSATRRVALADLQPGDLVFYGDSGETSHHMGLFIGDGQMIEAPYTGAYVRYASIWRSDILPYGGRP